MASSPTSSSMFLIKIERSAIERSMYRVSLRIALWGHKQFYEGAHTNRDRFHIGVRRLELDHVRHFDGRTEGLLVKLLKQFFDVVVVEDRKSFVEVSWFLSDYG